MQICYKSQTYEYGDLRYAWNTTLCSRVPIPEDSENRFEYLKRCSDDCVLHVCICNDGILAASEKKQQTGIIAEERILISNMNIMKTLSKA